MNDVAGIANMEIRMQCIRFLNNNGIRCKTSVDNEKLCDAMFMYCGWEIPYRKERWPYIRRFWSKFIAANAKGHDKKDPIQLAPVKAISDIIAFSRRPDFYTTQEWRELRYQALKKYGAKCQCCGRKPPQVILHVDHINPKSGYPELCLTLDNLQILCEDCNLGKGVDHTDWRKRA